MKSTLADIKQLFNVKNIAYNTKIEDLQEGDFGVFESGNDTSVAAGTTFATLPETFRLVAKFNGKLLFGIDEITKSKIINRSFSDYQAEKVNIWETTIDNCDCMKEVLLNINIDERSLEMRDGMTWTHRDFVIAVSPKELDCLCDCEGKKVYENNVLTAILHNKIQANNSPFYTSRVKIDTDGIDTYADEAARDAAITDPSEGQVVITGTDLTQYDGDQWVVVGESNGNITDVDAFTKNGKSINTDDDTANDGAKLTLVLEGKIQSGGLYADLDVNYVYPRGVKLNPALTVNGVNTSEFTQVQQVEYERNAGYDLRKTEFENMNYYTTLNGYFQLSDKIQSSELVYQFENRTDYDTVVFEFGTLKSGLESVFEGPNKMFMMILGAETGSDESTELQDLFIN